MIEPMLLLVALASAGSITLGTLFAVQQWARPRRAVRTRLDSGRAIAFNPAGVLRQETRRFPLVGRLPLSSSGRERTQLELDRAGVHWRVQEFLALRLALAIGFAVATATLLTLVGFSAIVSLLVGLPVMIFGWMLPRQYLSRRRKRRMVAIEAQLPDALMRIAKSLRVGSGLLQSLGFAADETPAPLGPELANALRDLQLGADPVEAFGALSARVGNSDLDIAVTAVIIQRTVGGNLAEILGNVSNTIRERAKIQREIRVLVARQMLQANLTAALPVLTALLFITISPDIGGALIHTTVGNLALAFAAVCEVAGIYVVRRMAVIEI